jgi:hypothetical protein
MARKLKGGALYVSVIISILISIILSLFIVVAYYNTRSVQAQNSLLQLQLSLESGFAIAQSDYYQSATAGNWQKMGYNNDSLQIKKMAWGCYTLIDVKAKNAHFHFTKTGLFGTAAWRDTAIVLAEQNRPIGLAGKIRFRGACYFPKAGVKSAYIEGTGFSDLNAVRPYIRPAPDYIPPLDEDYLEEIERSQSGIDPYQDSLLSFIPEAWNQSFKHQTAVLQQGSMTLNIQVLSNNIKLIASDVITVESGSQLTNVLLIARKVIFKKGFKGTVHVISRDSIVTEDECEFNYPSSFCVYNNQVPDSLKGRVRGIFFGLDCKFKGGLLAANDKKETSRMIIKLNKHFELIGSIYSSDYADAQGNLYGSLCCRTLLLQTASGVYENHLFNCFADPKRYSTHLSVPSWLKQKQKQQTCAQWF